MAAAEEKVATAQALQAVRLVPLVVKSQILILQTLAKKHGIRQCLQHHLQIVCLIIIVFFGNRQALKLCLYVKIIMKIRLQ